jgi:hypothetical protein
MTYLRGLLAASLLALCACASVPAAVQALDWRDAWGDRGQQVLARDYVWCVEAVENRRSLLGACMAARGWRLENE